MSDLIQNLKSQHHHRPWSDKWEILPEEYRDIAVRWYKSWVYDWNGGASARGRRGTVCNFIERMGFEAIQADAPKTIKQYLEKKRAEGLTTGTLKVYENILENFVSEVIEGLAREREWERERALGEEYERTHPEIPLERVEDQIRRAKRDLIRLCKRRKQLREGMIASEAQGEPETS